MINHLKGLEISSIYDFDNAFSINELLCKMWEKIEETINISNESIDILNWIKEQALSSEVERLITQLVEDGTIEQMINVDKIEEIRQLVNTQYADMLVTHNDDITALNNRVDTIENTLTNEVDTFKEEIQNQVDDMEIAFENVLNSEITDLENNFEALSNSIDTKLSSIKYVKNQQELKEALVTGNIIYLIASINLTEIMKLPSYIKIIGKGNVTLTTNQNAIFITAMTNPTGYNGNSNIYIEGITFDGKDNDTDALTLVGIAHANNVVIKNCTFKNLHIWHMLEINGSKDVIVDNCVFENYGNSGTQGTEALQIDAMIDSTVYPWGGAYDNTVCDNVTIQNCSFNNIGSAVLTEDRIKAIGNHTFKSGVRSRNIKILNNTFNNVNFAIHMNDIFNMTITGNTCEESHNFFRTETVNNTSENIILSNNTFIGLRQVDDNGLWDGRFAMIQHQGNTGSSIIDGVTIIGNLILNSTGHGIGFTADNVRITSNYIRTCGRNCIYAFGGQNIVIGDNITGQANTGYYGIKVGDNAANETYKVLVHGNLSDINIAGNSRHIIVNDNIGTIVNDNGGTLNDNF